MLVLARLVLSTLVDALVKQIPTFVAWFERREQAAQAERQLAVDKQRITDFVRECSAGVSPGDNSGQTPGVELSRREGSATDPVPAAAGNRNAATVPQSPTKP